MALLFNADGERVNHGSPTALDTISNLTVALWVKTPGTMTAFGGSFFGKGSSGGDGWTFVVGGKSGNDVKLAFTVKHATIPAFYAGGFTFSPDTWHYIVATWDAGGSAND